MNREYKIMEIIKAMVEVIATCADAGCAFIAKDAKLVDEQLNGVDEGNIHISKWNGTSLANIAYLTLNAPRQDQRVKSMRILINATSKNTQQR